MLTGHLHITLILTRSHSLSKHRNQKQTEASYHNTNTISTMGFKIDYL